MGVTDDAEDDPEHSSGFFAEIADIYRASRKEHDIAWNVYVARPLASVLLYVLRRTPLTPNQVTFIGAFVFVGVAAALILLPGWAGILVAAAVLEFSYLFDCVDGQLARLKGMTSDVGAYLDFLIDEVKALLLVGAASVRVWMETGGLDGGDPAWLLVGIGGCVLVSIATSLTTFVRREAYAGQEVRPGASAKQDSAPPGLLAKGIWLFKRTASFVVHYPSWFVFIALADGIAGFNGTRWFLYLFLGVYVVYTAKTGLGVVLKLGSPTFYDNED